MPAAMVCHHYLLHHFSHLFEGARAHFSSCTRLCVAIVVAARDRWIKLLCGETVCAPDSFVCVAALYADVASLLVPGPQTNTSVSTSA